MNREVVKEWVAELRSGKYTQGKRLLRSANDEYCCLGVLCELAVKHGVIEPAELKSPNAYGYGNGSEWYGALPPLVTDWIGLSTAAGGYVSRSLTELNDNGTSFAEIADIIESEPEGLFKERNEPEESW